MKNLTVKTATKLLTDRGHTPRHNMKALVKACRSTAKEISASPMEVYRLMVFNQPIAGMYTHSYGFHTGTGRHIIETTGDKYYQILRS
jgi:hypothetical protein